MQSARLTQVPSGRPKGLRYGGLRYCLPGPFDSER